MSTPIDDRRIKASPTKAFFISMLTRDVPLTRAILDLVDNCVDGARRTKPDNNYDGLRIDITINRDTFQIEDNCGGIPVQVARDYAFRFGRPADAEATIGSIGQFGVGMKRSFFKIGKEFHVASCDVNSRFSITVNVERWLDDDREDTDWHFQFDSVEENLDDVAPEDVGTEIRVTELHETVATSFELENFRTELSKEISAAHSLPIDRGLVITLNGSSIHHTLHKLLHSDVLVPAFVQRTFPLPAVAGAAVPPVHVRLYAGLSERDLHAGGWYIFCNGRQVVGADQTSATIWGRAHNLREYHTDYAYFRGFAYFDSENAAGLPWTTTKTGVDLDSTVYRAVQREMIDISRPVIEFLKRVEQERRLRDSGDSDNDELRGAIANAEEVRVEEITSESTFRSPPGIPRRLGAHLQKIQYSKPADIVDMVKRMLGVNSFTAVGEKTFEYFLRNEGDE